MVPTTAKLNFESPTLTVGMIGYTEVDYFPTGMMYDEEHIQISKSQRRNSEKIHGCNAVGV